MGSAMEKCVFSIFSSSFETSCDFLFVFWYTNRRRKRKQQIKTCRAYANSEGLDQPVHPCSRIQSDPDLHCLLKKRLGTIE